jgi:hypothetical protein
MSEPLNDNSLQTDVQGQESTEPTLQDILTPTEPTPSKSTEKEEQKGTSEDLPKWISQLPKELIENADFMKQVSKFKTIGELSKSYSELEKKLGTSIQGLNENSSDEEKQKFWEKLGKPTDADGYGKEEQTKQLRDLAFKANLTKEQADVLFNGLASIGENFINDNKSKLQEMYTNTEAQLKKEYGASYQEKLQLVSRGINAYGNDEVRNLLTQSGIIFHPSIVKMFIKMGETTTETGLTPNVMGLKKDGYKSIAEGGQFSFKDL